MTAVLLVLILKWLIFALMIMMIASTCVHIGATRDDPSGETGDYPSFANLDLNREVADRQLMPTFLLIVGFIAIDLFQARMAIWIESFATVAMRILNMLVANMPT